MDKPDWTPGRMPDSQKRFYPSSAQSFNPSSKKRRLIAGFEPYSPANPPSFPPSQAFTNAEQRPRFKALPVPRSHYQPSLCLQGSQRPLTVPEEPVVLSRSRSCSLRLEEHSQEAGFRARPMPDFSKPMEVRSGFTPTAPQPFALRTEERGLEKVITLHHRLHLENMRQAELQRFTARPVPVFSCPQPLIQASAPTVPQPFPLSNPPRVQLPSFPTFNAFRAKPMPDFTRPFQPELEGKHTEPMEVELNSDLQAMRRAQFEAELRDKEQKAAQATALSAQLQAAQEAEALKVFRKALEFHALPLPSGLYQRSKGQVKDENSNRNLGESTSYGSTEDSMVICDQCSVD